MTKKFFIFRRIFARIKNKGLVDSLKSYISNEMITCRFFITKIFRKFIGLLFNRKQSSTSKKIVFCYDSNVTPITFDIIGYLSQCELERRKNMDIKILFVFIINKKRKLKPNLQRIKNNIFDSFEWRLSNLIIQSLNLFPNINKYFVTNNFSDVQKLINKDDKILPHSYFHQLPRQPSSREIRNSKNINFPLISVNKKILSHVKRDFDIISKKKKVILISLTEDKLEFKSNLEEWLKFAQNLNKKLYCPIFISDHSFVSYSLFSEFKNNFYHKAVWSVELRAAAYQNAYLNMSVGHGPMELCYYNHKVKYIVFFKSSSMTYKPNNIRKLSGWKIGKNLSFANKYQKIIWEEDNFKNISREFKNSLRRLK